MDTPIDFTIKKGFTNFGNTCFYNATLQSIFRCEELIERLKNYEPAKDPNKLLKYLRTTIQDYYLKPEVIGDFGPSLLLRSYREMNQNYMYGSQDCSLECLTYFLDNFIEASKLENINIAELFDCNLKSKITCGECATVSVSNANEKVIILPIKNETTYEGSMKSFLSEEKLTDDNLYDCEKCKKKVSATKKLVIKNSPKYLYVALKRFEFNYIKELNKIRASKIDTDISMPCVTTINNFEYQLKGCIYHMGSLNGGHYVYYHRIDNQWILFDDKQIRNVNTINDIINKGYVYLYERTN
jgi:ubiquitin carboxyl-terminal hydrolase 36/42